MGARLAISALCLGAAAAMAGCGPKRQASETFEQRAARQLKEFEATPDIKGDELKRRLVAAGVPTGAMTPTLDDYQEEVLMLKVDRATFARLDQRKLAKLVLDSRYRFEFTDPGQVRAFAQYVGAETNTREKAKAIGELRARGELGKVPRYHAGEPMRSFANRLELYCGIEPGMALLVRDVAWLDWSRSYARATAQAGADGHTQPLESFDCLKRVIDATEVRRHFIGNRGREGAIDY